MIPGMKTQPVAVIAAVVAAVKAVLAALIILQVVRLTGEQVATLAVAVETVLGVPAVLFVRSRVSPVDVSAPPATSGA